MDDLLHLVNSDRADGLRLHGGDPPVLILDGTPQALEGSSITSGDAEEFLQSIANTRQRRELRECGKVMFTYRFRRITTFVVCVRLDNGIIRIDIQ